MQVSLVWWSDHQCGDASHPSGDHQNGESPQWWDITTTVAFSPKWWDRPAPGAHWMASRASSAQIRLQHS